jgi:hypothetical protein
MPRRLRKLRCPICKKPVVRADAEFPLCSERCRAIDLGKWASGAYVVSTPALDPDALTEDLPGAQPEQEPLPSSDDAHERRKS